MKKKTSHENHIDDFWYRLDNAGKLYPSIASSELTTVFRISVTLKGPVKITPLQKALGNIIGRFPYYRVHLHKGFFWYYLEHTKDIPKIIADSRFPCEKIPMKRRGAFLFRVRVYKNRIALEFSHTLTDGAGALVFLKALAAEYINLVYGPFDEWDGIFRPGQEPLHEEAEDSFIKYYSKKAPPPQKGKKAFHLPYKRVPRGIHYIITGIVPLDKLSGLAKEKKVSINDLLIAVLIEAFQEVYFRIFPQKAGKSGRPIRIMIPINLRKFFNSSTMRNFSLFTIVEVDPRLGRYSFEEILARVHQFILMEANAKSVQPDMARNVRGELNMAVRLLPLFVKDLILTGYYKAYGGKITTSSLSNLGIAVMPDAIGEYIEGFDFIPVPDPKTKCNCGVISFKDKVHITFGRTVNENDIERIFFNRLVRLGVPVKLQSN